MFLVLVVLIFVCVIAINVLHGGDMSETMLSKLKTHWSVLNVNPDTTYYINVDGDFLAIPRVHRIKKIKWQKIGDKISSHADSISVLQSTKILDIEIEHYTRTEPDSVWVTDKDEVLDDK